METILFIETARNGSSREAFLAAHRLGYSSILLTKRKRFLCRTEGFPPDTRIFFVDHIDEETIRETIVSLQQEEYQLQAVISFVDPFISVAAALSNEFCQSDMSVEAFKLIEDKSLTRKAMVENPASIQYEVFQQAPSRSAGSYPKVLKRTVSSGSKDVFLVENEDQLNSVIRKLSPRHTSSGLIIEEYMEGPQYNIELFVCRGIPIIAAIVQQEITYDLTFIVTGYAVCLNMEQKAYKELWVAIMEIIRDIGLHHGTCHMEVRQTDSGWKLIEINPRISGGAMNQMVEEATGINIVEETIKMYVGKEPDLIRKRKQPVYTSYITINGMGYLLKVDGLKEAEAVPGVVDVHLTPEIGSLMMPALSMGYRYGYSIAKGDTEEEAKCRAEQATSLLKFYLEQIE